MTDGRFCRSTVAMMLTLAATAALSAAVPLQAASAPPSVPHLLVVNCPDQVSLEALLSDLGKAGALPRHVFPPHVAIVEMDEAAAEAALADPRVDLVTTGFADPETAAANYGRLARDAVNAWNQTFVLASSEPAPEEGEIMGEPLVGDWLLPPDEGLGVPRREGVSPAPPGAAGWQTSEFMMGSVYVSVILVESNGAIDTDTEDWTSTEESNVVSEILQATNWWAGHYPYSVAPVSFTYTYTYGAATSYEPITRPQSDEGLWMAEILTNLGYPCDSSTYLTAARNYDDDLRNNNNKDWAFTIFVVDSSADADGKFSDGWFAYAYIGGPLVVMTYDNDGWGISNMNRVLSHEMGHIFRAADEYSGCSSSGYFGYLKIQNTNCGTDPTCVMNNNVLATCTVTEQQIGWRDTDADGVPDILDVAPTASVNAYAPDPTSDATPTYTGSASVGYYPNQLNPGADCTINRIANVQYRVDGGSWQNAAASDGAFDEGAESYTFTPSSLSVGTHTIEVRAVDTSGNTTAAPYPSDTITIAAGHNLSLTAGASPTTVESGGSVSLSATATDTLGHGVASWAWDDGGAGGTFSPSAAAQNPTYTAPTNGTGFDIAVTITVNAVCDGSPSTSGSDSVALAVRSASVAQANSQSLPSAMEWDEQQSVSITYQNIGTTTWTVSGGYGLAALNSLDRWGVTSVALASDVAPGGAYDFNFAVTAPPLTTLVYSAPVSPTAAASDDTLACAWRMAKSGTPLPGDTASSDVVISRFEDVQPGTAGAWARFWVEECAGRVPPVVSGYGDGTYRPTVAVDRAAMAVYMARALKLPTAAYEGQFDDVLSDHWAWPWIEALARAGIVGGYGDGTYRPSVVVNRDAMAVYVARGMCGGMAVPTGPATPTFSDVPTDQWAYDEIEYAAANGVVHGYGDGTYRPDNPVTRDQMAVYVYRGFIMPTGAPVVLGGPAITAVDPSSASYWGWSSQSSGPASDPGYAYLILDALRLDPDLAGPDGTFDVTFQLTGPSSASQTVSLTGANLTTLKSNAAGSGVPYCAIEWDIPSGLSAGDYTLTVTVEDAADTAYRLARTQIFTITP